MYPIFFNSCSDKVIVFSPIVGAILSILLIVLLITVTVVVVAMAYDMIRDIFHNRW